MILPLDDKNECELYFENAFIDEIPEIYCEIASGSLGLLRSSTRNELNAAAMATYAAVIAYYKANPKWFISISLYLEEYIKEQFEYENLLPSIGQIFSEDPL